MKKIKYFLTLIFAISSVTAFSQRPLWEILMDEREVENYPYPIVINNYSIQDGTLESLDWSLLNTKNQKASFTGKGLELESKIKNGEFLTTSEHLNVNIDFPTAYIFNFHPGSVNEGSLFGIVFNYDEEESNYEALLFDKKNYYVIRFKDGRVNTRHTGKNPVKDYNLCLGFENGKISYCYYDPKYKYYNELWSGKGELKNSNLGFYISGANKITVKEIIVVQAITQEEE